MAGAAGLAIFTGGMYWKTRVPYYTVARVIDGDTFETTEKQLVRLYSVNAPELEYCGGKEAKMALEKLVLGKPVYLKVIYRDRFMRLDSWVYTKEGFVNAEMAKMGKADYVLSGKSGQESEMVKSAQDIAKKSKLGIFGPDCTQVENIKNPKCIIKGNNRQGAATKLYHFPGCEQYKNTAVQLYLGDNWFCSEKEAKEAGFVKANGCP